MMRFTAAFIVLALTAVFAQAQPIHDNPQKAAYASQAEWPTISGDCWWLAPGSGGLPGIPSHAGHMTLTYPYGAETIGGPLAVRFAITLFNTAGRVNYIFGRRLQTWTLDNGVTFPLQGDPTGVRTWTGTVVIDTSSGPLRGWYQIVMGFATQFANRDVTYTMAHVSFYSIRDPTAVETLGFGNHVSNRCEVADATNGGNRWGSQITEFQLQTLPLLGPISPELPWTVPAKLYNYGRSNPLPVGIFALRLDPDFHNNSPGILLDQVEGGAITRAYTFPTNIPDGTHKIMYQWRRPDFAGTRELVSNLVFTFTVGPGGVAQPGKTVATSPHTPTAPPTAPNPH